ncbi:helix-turn-helix domain-containing protein [Kitasatospora sp. NPDC059463]|uniref:helix-turn-helix domain-containing protein n=1 Tax=unclassified Kitasatospora TaxID=2633591 RepID=UPI0036CC5372
METDEFAGMLRALKERSGHSYGVLATRLHVSTSTLHRYCNGAAVPTEYAPVERFARACGADDGELVLLHRRWIVADAARRREAGAAASRPRPAAPVPPAQAPAPTPTPMPTPTPSAEPAQPPVPAAVLPPVAPAALPTGHRRRRVRALLGAVTAVLLVAAVSAFVLHGRGQPAALPPTAPDTPAVTPPSTPVVTTPPAPAVPVPTAPVPTATTPPEDDLPAPFHVTVLTDNWGSPCGQWFLSPRSPGQVTAPPDSPADIDSWAAAQQGVPGGHLRLQLTAQGTGTTPVVLHAAYIQVVSTRPAPKGNAYTPGSGCGGGLTPAAFTVNLDSAAPRATPVQGLDDTGRPTLSNFPYRVSAADPQVIDIDAATAAQDVSWYLDLVWSSGDRQGRLRVDDHGRPFRTAGIRDAPAYSHTGRNWSPTEPDL